MTNAIAAADITGLILAGGRGSRIGGADKGLRLFRGEPLILHVARRLAPQVGSLMINANRNLDAYRALGAPIVPDDIEDFAGPLAGIHAGLEHCQTPFLAVAPCDSPLLPHDLVQRLAAALIGQGADIAVAGTAAGGRFRWQPVFCLLKTSALPSLTQYLEEGGRKVETWQKSQQSASVDFPDPTGFANLNTPEDWLQSETD